MLITIGHPIIQQTKVRYVRSPENGKWFRRRERRRVCVCWYHALYRVNRFSEFISESIKILAASQFSFLNKVHTKHNWDTSIIFDSWLCSLHVNLRAIQNWHFGHSFVWLFIFFGNAVIIRLRRTGPRNCVKTDLHAAWKLNLEGISLLNMCIRKQWTKRARLYYGAEINEKRDDIGNLD